MIHFAPKCKKGCRDDHEVFNALTNVDVAEAAFEGLSIAKDKGDSGRATEVPVFARFFSSQSTDDIEVIGQEKLDVEEKASEASVAGYLVYPVSDDATRNGAPSHACFKVRTMLVPSSGVEEADLVALCTHIQELKAEIDDLLDRLVEIQKFLMDTLLKSCAGMKNGALELDMKRFSQQLADIRAERNKNVIETQATKNAVAAKEDAKKKALGLTDELSVGATSVFRRYLFIVKMFRIWTQS